MIVGISVKEEVENVKTLIWRIFARKRKQCCNCKKTFYKPFRGTVEVKAVFKTFEVKRIGCPHCLEANFIQV